MLTSVTIRFRLTQHNVHLQEKQFYVEITPLAIVCLDKKNVPVLGQEVKLGLDRHPGIFCYCPVVCHKGHKRSSVLLAFITIN